LVYKATDSIAKLYILRCCLLLCIPMQLRLPSTFPITQKTIHSIRKQLSMPASIASFADIPALTLLINSAYRGEASKKGWTTEADLLLGERRTDESTLAALMAQSGAVLLKYTNDAGDIIGSVYLHKQDRGLYLGMLTVNPLLQAGGIGRQLMGEAEAHAVRENCPCIFMNVISVRSELINWYKRLGYAATGETKPMPTDTRFGTPVQALHFIIMEKKIKVAAGN
jgi:ribosomal protein S18 acetylase RimI-like enzyme